MKIPETLQPLLASAQRDIPSLLKQLQVGQVLPATVLAQLKPNVVRLQLATIALLARTPIPLDTGSQLKLQVVSKTRVPELQILRDARTDTTPVTRRARSRALRTAVARQLPPADVRQRVAELKTAAASPRESTAVQRFEAVLRDAGIRPAQATPQAIQRAVANSGVFHEARLQAHAAVPHEDVKARLLQLLKVFTAEARSTPRPAAPPADGDTPAQGRPQPAESLLLRLVRLVEASVSRIQLQQTAALPVEDSPRQAWQVDLPVQLPDGSDDVQLRIERETGADGDGDGDGWSVNLVFDFDTIGPLQCRIGLAGDRVATTFWCDRASTHSRVEQRLPVLQKAFEAQGLEVTHLAGVLGHPAEPLMTVPLPDSLLDERA
ncbi:MAG: flagellar hook-length control protein FliK [Gammaproteobacteria bacterium]|nr:flagellar hook-length control protein FliK [Gammaproteobacteria bacterium]